MKCNFKIQFTVFCKCAHAPSDDSPLTQNNTQKSSFYLSDILRNDCRATHPAAAAAAALPLT